MTFNEAMIRQLRRAQTWGITRTVLAFVGSLALAACGGGSSTPDAVAVPALVTGSNVIQIVVDSGPAGSTSRNGNSPYVNVTICPPGSTSGCQTIDHVIVDTGSTGLRILASALSNPSVFPTQVNGSSQPYAECAQFVYGNTWGPIRTADIRLGSLTAPSVPIQVVAEAGYSSVPSACSSSGTIRSNSNDLHANGILGVGYFRQDCGNTCVSSAPAAGYYACATPTSCVSSTIPRAKQVSNPVPLLPTDNNGVMIQMPAVTGTGTTDLVGALAFGVGTRTNNDLGSAAIYGVNSSTGLLTTTYKGVNYTASAFDSGSNFYFFTDNSITGCTGSLAGYYCPASPLALSATIRGTNAVTGTVNFNIVSAFDQFGASATTTAIPDVGATLGLGSSFLWGLPFYYGKKVYTAVEGATTPGGTGPYVAF